MSGGDRLMRLLEEFAARRARGDDPDVGDYLERAGADAEEFGRLVEALLLGSAPPEPSAERVAMMGALLADEPPLLALRHRRGVTVDHITDLLMSDLGVPPASRPRLRALYQRLEGGLLDLGQVAAGVRTCLAAALGVAPGDIVAARAGAHGEVFARGDLLWDDALDHLPVDDLPGPPSAEVDALFGLSS